ncbi:MAG: hypothetical protein E2593_09320 [Stenotrophomonas sp.]|nr:hypothetical protein [Stenotrophomonas sp.]
MHLIETPVTAWIPVRTALWRDRIEASEIALADLSEALPSLVPVAQPGLRDVDAAIAEPPAKVRKRLLSNILVDARLVKFLRIKAQHTLDRDVFDEQNPGREFNDDIFSSVAAMHLGEAMETLLMFSELSHPGRISTTQGVVLTSQGGNTSVQAKSCFSQLWHPEKNDPTWPAISTLPLQNVLSWVNGTSFFTNALAVSRIERSLAAFTQMVHLGPYKEGETLFRAMQSLEAFYCDGTGDLRKQLADKAALWVGLWKEPKNIVGHLYDMRSKFVHGGAKLQYWSDHADPWEEDEKHMRSFGHAVTLAARLAVATLQRCVIDEVHHIEWSYAVKTS